RPSCGPSSLLAPLLVGTLARSGVHALHHLHAAMSHHAAEIVSEGQHTGKRDDKKTADHNRVFHLARHVSAPCTDIHLQSHDPNHTALPIRAVGWAINSRSQEELMNRLGIIAIAISLL